MTWKFDQAYSRFQMKDELTAFMHLMYYIL